MTAKSLFLSMARQTGQSLSVFARDIGNGLLVVSHNTLAVLGLAVVALVAMAASQEHLRSQVESQALAWLKQRHEARAEVSGDVLLAMAEPDAITRATATDPGDLPKQQAAIAQWIAKRYRVAPEPMSRLVQEAYAVGAKAKLDPTLILAIMAVESSFNPFAQSHVGAQGLMQVMTHIHDDKYVAFGGNLAAFDPVTNLRVGVQVLKECIARAGSVEDGLRYYVGAANLPEDGGYAQKVLYEQQQMKQVAAGRKVPFTVTSIPVKAKESQEAASTPTVVAQQVALLQ